MTNGDLRSLGDVLRQAREAQALSIEEVESRTRIRAKFIDALESGDFAVLPSTAHARGFLRNYAQFLQLDVEQIVEQFSELTGTGTRVVTAPTQHDSPPPQPEAVTRPAGGTRPMDTPAPSRRVKTVTPGQRTGPGKPLGLGQTQRQPAPTPPPKTESQNGGIVGRILRSNIFTLAILVIGLVAIAWWSTTRLSTITSADIPSNGQSTPAAAGDGAPTLEPTATFRLTSTPEEDTAPQILDRIVLSITVDQRTWTEIIVDGEPQFEGQALKGQVLRFEGREEIYIRTGNGAGLLVNYNGQDIGPLGERGKVTERFFLVDGQVTPTPTPSVAPTNTSVPTPTPSHTPEP